jgi:hypothetical protein
MKTMFRGTVAAIALLSMAGVAQAQTHSTTNQRHYAANVPVIGNVELTNPANNFLGNAARGAFEAGIANGIGTRYTASTTAADDTETASPTVSNAFTLTGTVNKDCSFYAGNNAAARNIDFGVIGVRTGNNENVGAAFEMAGPLTATIQTLTAGCNFNNEVKIQKTNPSGGGMQLVGNPGGFDVTQFQSNIPYEVTASWQGVALDAVTQGSAQSLVVAANSSLGTKQQGAWRSAMTININAPALTNRGLVAGKYEDTLTVTLSAL